MKISIILCSLLLLGSLIANVFFFLGMQIDKISIQSCETDMSSIVEEIHIINDLIPMLKPGVSKEELETAFKSLIPDEKIEILKNQVSWRFYHFWYSDEDKISNVTYGS
jgi:hypothetical protein